MKDKKIAILEGSLNQQDFIVKSKISAIPSRDALAFVEIPNEQITSPFTSTSPLLIVLLNKNNKKMKSVVWGQIDLRNGSNRNIYQIDQETKPSIQDHYKLLYKEEEADLWVQEKNERELLVTLSTNSKTIDCHCDRLSPHFANCYPNGNEKMFHVVFHEKSIRYLKSMDQEIAKQILVKNKF